MPQRVGGSAPPKAPAKRKPAPNLAGAPFKPGTPEYDRRVRAAHVAKITGPPAPPKKPQVQPKQVGSTFGLTDVKPGGPTIDRSKGVVKRNAPGLTEQVALARARKQRLAHGGLLTAPQRAAEKSAAAQVETKTNFATPPPGRVAAPPRSTPAKPAERTGVAGKSAQIYSGKPAASGAPLGAVGEWLGKNVAAPAYKYGDMAFATGLRDTAASLAGVGGPSMWSDFLHPGQIGAHAKEQQAKGYQTSAEVVNSIDRAHMKRPDVSLPVGWLNFEGTAYAGTKLNPNARIPFSQLEDTGFGLTAAGKAALTARALKVMKWNPGDVEGISAQDLTYKAYNKPPNLLLRIAEGAGKDLLEGGSNTVGMAGLASEVLQGRGVQAAKDFGGQLQQIVPVVGKHPFGQEMLTHPLFAAAAAHGLAHGAGAIGHLRPGEGFRRNVELNAFDQAGNRLSLDKGHYSKNIVKGAEEMVGDKITKHSARATKRVMRQEVVDKAITDTRDAIAPEHVEVQVPYKQGMENVKPARAEQLLAHAAWGGTPGLKDAALHFRRLAESGQGDSAHYAAWADFLDRAREETKTLSTADAEYLKQVHTISPHTTQHHMGLDQFGETAALYRRYELPIEHAAALGDPVAMAAKAARLERQDAFDAKEPSQKHHEGVLREVERQAREAEAEFGRYERQANQGSAEHAAWQQEGKALRKERPTLPKLGVTAKDFEGEVGNQQHITRTEHGQVPVSNLTSLEGVKGEKRGEHRNKQGEEWTSFVEDVRKNGVKSPIFITVDAKGARISEGNHRLDAAVEAGLTHVPVEIRYFGKAEQGGSIAGQRVYPTLKEASAAAKGREGVKVEKTSEGFVVNDPNAAQAKHPPGTMGPHRAAVKEWKQRYNEWKQSEPKVSKGREHSAAAKMRNARARADAANARAESLRHANPISREEAIQVADAHYAEATQAFVDQHLAREGATQAAYVPYTKPPSGLRRIVRTAGKQRFTPKLDRQKASSGRTAYHGEFMLDPKSLLHANAEVQRMRANVGVFRMLETHPFVERATGDGELLVPEGKVAVPVTNMRSTVETLPEWDSTPVGMHEFTEREHKLREKIVAAMGADSKQAGEVIPRGKEVFLIPKGMHDRIEEWAKPGTSQGFWGAYDRMNAAYQRLLIGLYPSTWMGNAPGSIPLAFASGAVSPLHYVRALQSGRMGPVSRRVGITKHPERSPASISGMGPAAGISAGTSMNPAMFAARLGRSASMLGEDTASRASWFGQTVPYVEGRVPTLRKMLPALDKVMPQKLKGKAAELNVSSADLYEALSTGKWENGDFVSPELKAKRDAAIHRTQEFLSASGRPVGGKGKMVGRGVLFQSWLGHILKLNLISLPLHHPLRATFLNAVSMYGNQYRQEHGTYPEWMGQFLPILRETRMINGQAVPGMMSVGLGQLTPIASAANLSQAGTNILDGSQSPLRSAAAVVSPLWQPFVQTVLQAEANYRASPGTKTYNPFAVGFARGVYTIPGLAKPVPTSGYDPTSFPGHMTKRQYWEYVPTGQSGTSYKRYPIPWNMRPGGRPEGGIFLSGSRGSTALGFGSRFFGLPLEWSPTGGRPLQIENSNNVIIEGTKARQRAVKKYKGVHH